MDMLTQELLFVLEGSDGAAERCAAMESLFWLQVSWSSCLCLALQQCHVQSRQPVLFSV